VILATRRGNVELRSEFGNASDLSTLRSTWLSQSGLAVTTSTAFGLPAVSNVIRSAAEVVASLPFMVYREGPVKERVTDVWQYKLLHDRPSSYCDSFEFFYDLALSLESTQNAFVQKAKTGRGRRRVYELYLLDPQRVAVRRDRETGEKLFDVYLSEGRVRRGLTTDEILHIRGFSPSPGAVAGVSLMQVHRDPLGAALAMQGFEGDYFRNGATPPFWLTGFTNRDQAKEARDSHNAQHQGVGRQWQPGFLWGPADVKSIPISMQDMLFVDAKMLSIEDACRIWRWPRAFAEMRDEQQVNDRNARMADFLKLNLLPRLRRIERAFAADPDIFWESGLFGEFLTAALERADFTTRVRGYKDARQGGWITGNEVRELENYPPLEGGDELLITPTGSAPNVAPGGRSFNGNGSLEHELATLFGEG
jgi:HK97 family phage portal protein